MAGRNYLAAPGVWVGMRSLRLGLLPMVLCVLGLPGWGQTAGEIMARVARNQDRAEAERAHYVYVQHARVVSRKGKTVMCEEVTDYRVTPTESGSQRELLKLDGLMLVKRQYRTYTALPPAKMGGSNVEAGHDSLSITVGDEEMDRDLVEHMRANWTDDNTKDGISGQLFPLTTKEQADYVFHLIGRTQVNGREVFHIDFHPKDGQGFGWKGEAWIDVEAYQPVVVRTDLARRVPLAVRTLLGTNVPGLGFSVVYAPQPDGVWLPASFGTEFKMHVLFLFHREVIVDVVNREFEKTHVGARIVVGAG